MSWKRQGVVYKVQKKQWIALGELLRRYVEKEEMIETMLQQEVAEKLKSLREKKLEKIRENSQKQKTVRSTEVLLAYIISKHMHTLPVFGERERACIKKLLQMYTTEELENMLEFAFTNPQLYFNYRQQYTKIGGIIPFYDNHLLIKRNVELEKKPLPSLVPPLAPIKEEELSPALRRLRRIGERLKKQEIAIHHEHNNNKHH